MDVIKIPIYRLIQETRLIVRYWFTISAASIVIFAAFLRFYNYGNRWGLAYDQAHDALVARYALEASKIPLVGPFSSAGPFQTGGEWYWFIMAATAIHKDSVLAPLIVLTLFYVAFVYFMILLGKKLIGKGFGIIVGLLAAVSTAQVLRSSNLTNQSLLAILALFAIFSAIAYIKERNVKYLFFLGLSISLAITMHLQGIALTVFIPVLFLFYGLPSKKGALLMLIGFILPLIPLLIFDLQHNFVNSKSLIQYYLYDQYKVSFEELGRRWVTYIGVFWPNAWGYVIGGYPVIGYFEIIILAAVVGYSLFKKIVDKAWYVIGVSFFGMLVILRYVRTPIFIDSYIIFLHPFILLLTGWVIFMVSKRNIFAAVLLLVIVIGGSLYKDVLELRKAENYTAFETNNRLKILYEKYPNEKFSIYDYKYKWADKNVALSLFLEVDKKIDSSARRIGIVIATKSGEFKYPILEGEEKGYQLLDLESATTAQLSDSGWVLVNAEEIYRSTQEWYSRKNK